MRNTFDHRILYGQMDDEGQSCQNLRAKLTGSGINGEKVREVGRRVSRHTVVRKRCRFVVDTRVKR